MYSSNGSCRGTLRISSRVQKSCMFFHQLCFLLWNLTYFVRELGFHHWTRQSQKKLNVLENDWFFTGDGIAKWWHKMTLHTILEVSRPYIQHVGMHVSFPVLWLIRTPTDASIGGWDLHDSSCCEDIFEGTVQSNTEADFFPEMG